VDPLSINKILSALADDTRRAIIMKLREGKVSTGELAEHIGITPQALSYHLSKLKKADIIYETKYKNFIFYELNLSVLGELIVWLDALKGDNDNEN
jgi:DNA-binding transcriptional ArsR family regulator